MYVIKKTKVTQQTKLLVSQSLFWLKKSQQSNFPPSPPAHIPRKDLKMSRQTGLPRPNPPPRLPMELHLQAYKILAPSLINKLLTLIQCSNQQFL